MTRKFGIIELETYIKSKCNFEYIHEIRNYALLIAHACEVYDTNVLFIIEMSSLLIKVNKFDIYKILNFLGFNHKFINIIIQTVKNALIENILQDDTFKIKDLLIEFPAIKYVHAGLNSWKKDNPYMRL